jgi:hypothetical protein
MATYNLTTDPIKLNEFRFFRENPTANPLYATKPFDGWSAEQTRLYWMMKNIFMHEKLFTDTCTVYIQTQVNFVGTALPYPDLEVINLSGSVIADLSVYPFIRGAQQISGNKIWNENLQMWVDANTYCWTFKFSDVLPASESGIYRLRLRNIADDGESYVSFITEPIFVYGFDASIVFKDTVLIECYNNSNNTDLGYFRGGWDDSAYFPVFRHRVDGYLTEFEPKSVYIGMLEQEYQPHKILQQSYRSWLFDLGGKGPGVPDFMHEKINIAFGCDVFSIDGKRYERDITDSDAGIKALWQTTKPRTANRRWTTTPIREYKNAQYIFSDTVANPCPCPTLTGVSVTKEGPTYYSVFTFYAPDGVECLFTVYVTSHYPGGSYTGSYPVNSLGDLVSLGGDNYYLKRPVGGYPDITYSIKKFGGSECYSGAATFDCEGPEFTVTGLTESSPGNFLIGINYSSCGGACQSVTFTRTQLLPSTSTPDTGSVTDTAPCPSGTSALPATPNDYTAGDTVKYALSWIDCCGNAGSAEVTYVPVPAPLTLWQSPWKEHSEPMFVPYALTSWTLGNGVDPNSPFNAYVMYDETEEDAVIAAMNVIISGLGYGGTITKDATTKIVTYNGVAGETPSNVIATRALWHHYSVDYNASSVGNVQIKTTKKIAGNGSQVVDWGDMSTYTEIAPATLGIVNMNHAYAAVGAVTANIFYEENVGTIALADTNATAPRAPITDVYGDLPSTLTFFGLSGSPSYGSLVSYVSNIDFTRCASTITSISIFGTNIVGWATGMWSHNMVALNSIVTAGNKLTSSAVDQIFTEFVGATATPATSGAANTSGQTPAAPPTAASLAERNSLVSTYSWTITTD